MGHAAMEGHYHIFKGRVVMDIQRWSGGLRGPPELLHWSGCPQSGRSSCPPAQLWGQWSLSAGGAAGCVSVEAFHAFYPVAIDAQGSPVVSSHTVCT